MNRTFSVIRLFQVKPDRLDEFEALIQKVLEEERMLPGCVSARCMKRFYTFDGVESGDPPRELTKIVKCVKYYSCTEFDCIEHCGTANAWFFERYSKALLRLLTMPFDISSGYTL